MPSLARLEAFAGREKFWDHVVLDELGMTREMTASPILRRPHISVKVDKWIGRVAERAKHVIMLQFDLSVSDVEYITLRCGSGLTLAKAIADGQAAVYRVGQKGHLWRGKELVTSADLYTGVSWLIEAVIRGLRYDGCVALRGVSTPGCSVL